MHRFTAKIIEERRTALQKKNNASTESATSAEMLGECYTHTNLERIASNFKQDGKRQQ